MLTSKYSYVGNVTFRTLTRNQVKHNTGTRLLFGLITSFLCKEKNDAKGLLDLPSYVMLYYSSKDDLVNNPFTSNHGEKKELNEFVGLVCQSDHAVGSSSSVFTATIDHTQIVKKFGDEGSHVLAIVSGDKKNILAVVDVDEEIVNVVQNGGQTHITWTMSFEDNKQINNGVLN